MLVAMTNKPVIPALAKDVRSVPEMPSIEGTRLTPGVKASAGTKLRTPVAASHHADAVRYQPVAPSESPRWRAVDEIETAAST